MLFTKFLCYKSSIVIAFITTIILVSFSSNTFAQTKTETTLNFLTQKIFTSSVAQTFTIRGLHLADSVIVHTNPPFLLSKNNVIYDTVIAYDTTEIVLNQTVYVKFKPTTIGNYADSVVSVSDGADNKIISLSGRGSAFNSGSYNNHLAANNVITPNGDGRNDTWVIKNIEQYPNNMVKLMDKSGNVIYSKRNYTNDWDGTYQNAPLPQGTYYYLVDFGEGQDMVFSGYITVVRD